MILIVKGRAVGLVLDQQCVFWKSEGDKLVVEVQSTRLVYSINKEDVISVKLDSTTELKIQCK